MCFLTRRLVWCQVSTPIDCGNLVDIGFLNRLCFNYSFCIKAYRLPNCHRDVALWRTQKIVTAKHAAALHDVGIAFVLVFSDIECRTIQCHRYVTPHHSGNVTCLTIEPRFLAQATTVGIALDEASSQVNGGLIISRPLTMGPCGFLTIILSTNKSCFRISNFFVFIWICGCARTCSFV